MQAKQQCAACGSIVTERNRYYTGKYMTARDFQGEQEYFRSRRETHNRLLHGWGIVCGLQVRPHTDPGCKSSYVIVNAGIALDCCGREIVMAADAPFQVRRPPEAPADPQAAVAALRTQLLLCLCYAETPIEYTPAIYDDTACEPQGEQANRIREGYCLKLLHLDEVKANCWHHGSVEAGCRDDCDDAPSATPCFEPECPCGLAVPLALLSFTSDKDEIDIDTGGRRYLPMHAESLTHIVRTNWTHSGEVTLAHLRHHMKGRLEIHFDRKIKPAAENRAHGVSALTFIAQFGGLQEDVRYLPFKYREPPGLEGDCVAVFEIDPRYLDPAEIDDLKGKMVYITLKCDFILDCRGIAVDGAHLGGTLPTRSGRAGGVFESWFYVADDDDRSAAKESSEESEQRPKPRPRRTQ